MPEPAKMLGSDASWVGTSLIIALSVGNAVLAAELVGEPREAAGFLRGAKPGEDVAVEGLDAQFPFLGKTVEIGQLAARCGQLT